MPTLPTKPKAALDPAVIFPGRATLYVHEAARILSVSRRHVTDLIEEGNLIAINVAGQNTSARKFWRIPVESLAAFLRKRNSLNQ